LVKAKLDKKTLCKLVLNCSGDCGETIPIPLPISADELANFLVKHKWYALVLTPMALVDKGVMHFGATCRPCAMMHMPEIVEMVEKGRYPKDVRVLRDKGELPS
jgi:hypothetical protein